jgi:hypothetical protein
VGSFALLEGALRLLLLLLLVCFFFGTGAMTSVFYLFDLKL